MKQNDSTFVEDDGTGKLKPIIFSGHTFLSHLDKTFTLCQAAALSRNFEQWCVLLMDMHSKLSWYIESKQETITIKDDNGKEQTVSVNEHISNELRRSFVSLHNKNIGKKADTYLVMDLMNVQKYLVTATRELYIGLTEKESNEYEMDQEDGG